MSCCKRLVSATMWLVYCLGGAVVRGAVSVLSGCSKVWTPVTGAVAAAVVGVLWLLASGLLGTPFDAWA